MYSPSKLNLKQKVAELSHGDEAAFRCLFEYYYEDVHAYTISLVKDKGFAEEITQDVFVKIWTLRENFKADLSLEAFLFTITRNMCFIFLRNAANDKQLAKKIFLEGQFGSPFSDYKLVDSEYKVIGQKPVKSPMNKTLLLMQDYLTANSDIAFLLATCVLISQSSFQFF